MGTCNVKSGLNRIEKALHLVMPGIQPIKKNWSYEEPQRWECKCNECRAVLIAYANPYWYFEKEGLVEA